MKQAEIITEIDLTEGGCNACGIVKCVSATLIMGGQEIPLGDLSVSSLVMTIALKNGFTQEMKTDILDDYILFADGTEKIKLTEDYDGLHYQNGQEALTAPEYISDINELTKQVNNILASIFKIEPLEFIY